MGSLGIMDLLPIEGYSESSSIFKFNPKSPTSIFSYPDSVLAQDSVSISSTTLYEPDRIVLSNQTSSCSESSDLIHGVGDTSEPEAAPDFSDACIKFLSDILMEEDLDDKPATLQDYAALQATEKSFYDAIGEAYLPPSDKLPTYLDPNLDYFDRSGSSSSRGSASVADAGMVGLNESSFSTLLNPEITQNNFDWIHKALSGLINTRNPEGWSPSSRQAKGKYHQRDDNEYDQFERSRKHLEAYKDDELQMEQFDDILLCREGKVGLPSIHTYNEESSTRSKSQLSETPKASKVKGLRGKKQGKNDMVDLNPLLTQCAQAVASFDFRGASKLIDRIRQHSSPFGDGIQRVAHYFANGLESRVAGTASQLYSDFINWEISASHFLKAYRSYVSAIPFKRTSFFLANKTILKLCADSTEIHIIDFGFFFGVQWPCFIQSLSQRPEGPPKLRITSVDFPERGYQPAARLEESGRRLAHYCKRFNVPFEYQAIAQRWETLKPEDFRIKEEETLVVNCLYKTRALLDDTVKADCPRDVFLKLITRLNPSLFIHGVVNGTYNAPFFTTRFKEALYHYSTVFDLFEATMPREDDERQLIEKELYGRDILNVVACEGAERVDRPETYKQWQVRTRRAGLRQVALDREIVDKAKAMVKANYHKDFVVNEGNNWMLQGWKGRILYAVSCWKPAA